MPTKLHTFFVLFLVFLTLNSCFKKEKYPLAPVVSYDTFLLDGTSNKAKIFFDFTDGDGNLGLLESDTLAPYNKEGDFYYNFILTYFEKDDNLGWVVGKNLEGDDIVLNFRLKPVLNYNLEKGIKGNISYDFDFYYNLLSDQSDTIKYQFQVIDRDLNKSNIGETDPILTP